MFLILTGIQAGWINTTKSKELFSGRHCRFKTEGWVLLPWKMGIRNRVVRGFLDCLLDQIEESVFRFEVVLG